MAIKTALDVSQYSGEISALQFLGAKDKGVSRVIVALNSMELARRQMRNAHAAGLEVEAYIYVYFAQDPAGRVRSCLEAIKDLPYVARVWVDCEDEKHSLAAKYLGPKIAACLTAVATAGYKTGVYTGAWWWKKHMQTDPNWGSNFRHHALWDAYWDKDADIDTPGYGGWTKAEMSQHTNDTTFAGIWCDINSYDDGQPTPPAPPPTPPVGGATTKARLQEIRQLLDTAINEL